METTTQPKIALRRRWLSPVADVTKAQLQKAEIETVAASRYTILVADTDNPVLVPEGDMETANRLRSQGQSVAFVQWNEIERCYIDPVTDEKIFPSQM